MTGRVLAANAAMEQLLGVEPGELVGKDALAMYVEGDRSGLESTLAELAAGRISYVQQDRTLRRPTAGPSRSS
jgi:PAS domain-containing protein